VSAGCGVGLNEECGLFLRRDGVRGDLDQVIRGRGEGGECRGLLLGHPRSDESRCLCRLFEPGEIQVVREGVACFFSLEDAESDAHVQPSGGGRDLFLVQRNAVGDGPLVIDIGEVAAAAETGLEEFLEDFLIECGRSRRFRCHKRIRFLSGEVPPKGIGDDERPGLHPFFQEASPVHQAVRLKNVHTSSFILG
jgi:hypothetical protein